MYTFSSNSTSTHPLPPLMSNTSVAICVLDIFILLCGFLLSLVLYLCISRRMRTAGNRKTWDRMLCIADMLLYFAFGLANMINAYNRQVPSYVVCQAQAVSIHFFATANFTTITFSVYDRHWRLCQIRDNKKDKGEALQQLSFIATLF